MVVNSNLNGRVALVTGGSRGIGTAICLGLAAKGANVVVNYARSEVQAEEVCQKIISLGGQAQAVQFDVATDEQVNSAVDKIVKDFGTLDILVNNAGVAIDSLVLRAKTEDWHKVINTNLSGAFYCARAVTKPMMKGRWGRIINISSVIGEMGNAGQVMYSASKSGLLGMTKSLARELAGRNVTVNAITPGYIQTEMTENLDQSVKQQILDQVPLARLGTPEDVAALVCFLASEEASYITGQVIGVNGGMYM